MGWKEARKRYQSKKTLGDQSIEDLVARRVLRGFDVVQRDLIALEYHIYDESYQDDALWIRVRRIMEYTFRRHSKLNLFRQWHIEVLESKADHSDILERYASVDIAGEKRLPVFFTRVKGTRTGIVYSTWPRDEIGLDLVPPYNVIFEQDGYHIAVQDITAFIKQFGPWNLGILRQ